VDAAVRGATVTAQVSDFGEFSSIAQQPSAQQVPIGGTAVFSVSLDSSAPTDAQFQWLLNRMPISNATTSQLVITNAGFANVGQYSVRITSPTLGPVALSQAATLAVLPFALNASLVPGLPAVNLQFPSSSGGSYQLQGSSDLSQWVNLGAPITGTGKYISVVQSTSLGGLYYYRLSTK
jgi:hypothetical protein